MAQIEQDLDPDVTIGLELPLKHINEVGFFKPTKTLLEQTKTNIKNLLLTRKGERVGNPEFGCDIHNFIFDQVTGDFQNKVEESIMEAITDYLPNVIVENVEAAAEVQQGQNIYIVNLSFSVENDPTKSEELTIEIESEGY